MTRGFLTITPQDTLDTVAKRMIETGNEYAVVKREGALICLVSADEIIREVKSSIVSRLAVDKFPDEIRSMLIHELLNNSQTQHFMESCGFEGTNLAICIGENNSIEEAIQLFSRSAIERCLVLDNNGIVGILTNWGLLKAITEMAQ
jgi:predicted transcriptional regulator